MGTQLAVNGGQRMIAEGTIKKWPPVTSAQMPWDDPDLMAIFRIKDSDTVNGWRGHREWATKLREEYGEPSDVWKRKNDGHRT